MSLLTESQTCGKNSKPILRMFPHPDHTSVAGERLEGTLVATASVER